MNLGVGLRPRHYRDFLQEKNHQVDWVEVISESFMAWRHFSPQGPLETLLKIREKVPVALHGVSLSIGSADPLDLDYLAKLKNLANRVDPFMMSDHLCWTGVDGENLHELLPLPYTGEVIDLVVSKIQQIQDFLGRPFIFENVSSYVSFQHSEMSEEDFLAEISRRSGCGLLLDINNLYINAINHSFDPQKYLARLPAGSVRQIHLAGHQKKSFGLVDTHNHPVAPEVWELYRKVLPQWGAIPAMIEWDREIPEWQRLMDEVAQIQKIQGEFRESP